jgi:predicted metal-dependent enzyme (double-stranded beta helix superfamily)
MRPMPERVPDTDLPPHALRDRTQRLIEVLDVAGSDVEARADELIARTKDILALPGLADAVANPAWSPEAGDGPAAGWLYQDGDVRITRGTLPAGYTLPPHNHGGWNIFGVYRGAVKYTSFRRLDDRTRAHHADLAVAEDRIMVDGDVTILPGPPHDIHTLTGLAETSTTILIARGRFSEIREHYLPDEHCYILRPGDARGYAR